ncbi:MAG TPA: hypothetical protein VGK54_01470 [Chloroflexota bacterium]
MMESRMYVGTEAGISTLKSTDGHGWSSEHEALGSWEVSAVAVVPGNPSQVLAGTRGDGVWLSEDAGKSWRKPCYGKRGPGKVRSLAVDPRNPRRIFAGTEPIDIFVSEDLGQTWERLDSVWDVPFVATVPYPVATVEPHVRSIALDPKEPNAFYAALQVGYMLKTTDAGRTWTLLNKDVDCDVHTIVIDPSAPERMFVATGGSQSRQGQVAGRGLYASTDAGQSWQPTAMEFDQEYSVPLTMDPRDPRILYSALAHGNPNRWRRESGAEGLLIRSRDGGQSWERMAKEVPGLDREFAEAIVVDPAQTERVYVGLRNGTFLATEDGGDSWVPLNVETPSVTSASLVRLS